MQQILEHTPRYGLTELMPPMAVNWHNVLTPLLSCIPTPWFILKYGYFPKQ